MASTATNIIKTLYGDELRPSSVEKAAKQVTGRSATVVVYLMTGVS